MGQALHPSRGSWTSVLEASQFSIVNARRAGTLRETLSQKAKPKTKPNQTEPKVSERELTLKTQNLGESTACRSFAQSFNLVKDSALKQITHRTVLWLRQGCLQQSVGNCTNSESTTQAIVKL